MFDVLSDMSRVRLFTKEEGGSQKECDGETNKRGGENGCQNVDGQEQ